jgi:hypothetical protein
MTASRIPEIEILSRTLFAAGLGPDVVCLPL